MNLKNYPRKDYSIDQFTQPLCFELEGKRFRFVMDNGYNHMMTVGCVMGKGFDPIMISGYAKFLN